MSPTPRLAALPAIAGRRWPPRVEGYDGRDAASNAHIVALAVERGVGGQTFRLDFSNDLGVTPGQIARGQRGPGDSFLGFDITPKLSRGSLSDFRARGVF